MPKNPGEWLATILVVAVLVYLFTVVASDETIPDHLAALWRVYVH